jgi:hypothetical protein
MKTDENSVRESPETAYQLAKGKRCDLKFWFRKLFSSEDPLLIHKLFGFSCVCSFIYRYYLLFSTGSLQISNDVYSWFTMVLHFSLSCSSLIFHVLAKRIVSRPMVIWEEYRLHAIVFTTRSVAVFVYSNVRHRIHTAGAWYEALILYVIVLGHHILADMVSIVDILVHVSFRFCNNKSQVTARHGSDKYTTVRIQDDHGLFSKLVLRFYAFYQFAAIASHVIPSDHLGDMGFNTLIAIQSSAFFMTLYRKALVAYYTHAAVYSFCLILSLYAMTTHVSRKTKLFFGSNFVVIYKTVFNLCLACSCCGLRSSCDFGSKQVFGVAPVCVLFDFGIALEIKDLSEKFVYIVCFISYVVIFPSSFVALCSPKSWNPNRS